MNIGENCKYCKCAKCKYLDSCGTMEGNTQQYCENDCLGENSTMECCSGYERS